jgi:hypothetical protein
LIIISLNQVPGVWPGLNASSSQLVGGFIKPAPGKKVSMMGNFGIL